MTARKRIDDRRRTKPLPNLPTYYFELRLWACLPWEWVDPGYMPALTFKQLQKLWGKDFLSSTSDVDGPGRRDAKLRKLRERLKKVYERALTKRAQA